RSAATFRSRALRMSASEVVGGVDNGGAFLLRLTQGRIRQEVRAVLQRGDDLALVRGGLRKGADAVRRHDTRQHGRERGDRPAVYFAVEERGEARLRADHV